MVNSIKFILAKRNLQQKDLTTENIQKQAVSRWILRERKINKNIIPFWEELLNVPAKYFVDDKGYCKELNDEELPALIDYLYDTQLLPESKNEYQDKYTLSSEVTKLQRHIREDICNIDDSKSIKENIKEQEMNLMFYKRILKLHKNKNISNDKWMTFFKELEMYCE